MTVVATDNLFDYFRDLIESAAPQSAMPLCDDTRLYLAALLTERARAELLPEPHDTLAELHAQAALATPAVQARTYRELGDRALYCVGYFEGALSQRTVGLDYYKEMGAAAYHRVDAVLKRWFSDAFGVVFSELARHFELCVDLLADVRDRHAEESPEDLLRLYERWLETGSASLGERLQRSGLVIPSGVVSDT